MEARAAAASLPESTASDAPPMGPPASAVAPVALDFESLELAPTPTISSPRSASVSSTRAQRRIAPRIVPLSRDQEHAYIRADMQRLLSIAGGLFGLMLVLLLILRR